MTHLELRILSGLHRGAALPLDGAPLELGAGEAADVVLADHGLAQRHARLVPAATGWRLEALDGEVHDAMTAAAQTAVDCPPGGCARLGTVWICVSPVDASWQAAPASVAEPAPQSEAQSGPVALGAAAATPSRAAAARTARAAARRRHLLLLPFLLVLFLCAATAYAFSARPAGMPSAPKGDVAAAAPATPATAPTPPTPPTTGRALTPAGLRAAFERELDLAQMRDRFELQLDDDRWRMRADLGQEEQERFERMLARFVAVHRIGFPVDARIVPSAALLPFRVEQVLSGAQAGIVTDGGQRLFVGDEYRGMRLVSMKDGRLVFAGQRTIEVQW